ncbi:MAG: ATP-binding protein [Acidimicrobiales bacterium]
MSGFPFSAVVGQDEAKLALILNAVDPLIGGVLLRGEKGSAKSTLARGLAGLLQGDAPFVELPVGATDDRVVGTIDIEAALTGGGRRFNPGLIAQAHGGVLYVDEVNLLPDHLVDVLLDVAASGVNRVERDGISESHAARFVLVGSMNPEEGELRPQLLDRFGLSLDVATSTDPGERVEAVRRRLAYDQHGTEFASTWRDADAALATRLAATAPASLPDDLLATVSRLCVELGAEGLRSDLVICRAAAALAGWEGRAEASIEDVRRVAPLALAHRRRRGPFDAPGVDPAEVDDALADCSNSSTSSDSPPSTDRPPSSGDATDGCGDSGGGASASADSASSDRPIPETRTDRAGDDEAPPTDADDPFRVVRLQTRPATDVDALASGRRSRALGRRGRQIGDRLPKGPVERVALGATVRAAAARRAAEPGGAAVVAADLREVVAEQAVGNLVVLAVDASGSMGVEHRMEAVKGATLSLLIDAYQRRDRVSLVTFRGDGAEVALRPTGSVEVARSRLLALPTGGRTPLAAGIRAALDVARSATGPHRPLLVLISDGRATAASEGEDPVQAARTAATEVRRAGVPAVVVDVEDGAVRLDLAGELALLMGARHMALPELSASALARAVHEAARP